MGARARGPSRDGQSFLLSSSARAGVLFVNAKKFFFRFASEFKPFSRHGPPALSSAREAAGVALQRRRERQVRPGEKKQGERERETEREERGEERIASRRGATETLRRAQEQQQQRQQQRTRGAPPLTHALSLSLTPQNAIPN